MTFRDGRSSPLLVVVAGLQAVVFGMSALFSGYYDFSLWGALCLCSFALLIAVLVAQPVHLGRAAWMAIGALTLLLTWTALSMSWAPSIDLAWTETNRIAFYLVTLLLATIAVRTLRTAWAVVGILAGASALVAMYVTARLVTGSGPELFVEFRLHEPVGYINGEAGFLLMAFWPLVAFAERPAPAALRGVALGLATLTAELLVLTQSRAIIPALFISTVGLVALVPGRLRRCWALLTIALAVVIALPSLLDVYAERSGLEFGLPSEGVVASAGRAIALSAAGAGVAWWIGTAVAPRVTSLRARAAASVVPPLVACLAVAWLVAVNGDPVGKLKSEYDHFVEQRIEPDANQRFTSAGGHRYDLWRIAAQQFEDHVVKGVGAGNYASTYYLERRNPDPVRQPHSLWMQMLAELGLVGLLLAATVFAAVLYGGFWLRSRTLVHEDRHLQLAAGGVVLVWLAQSSVDWLYNLPGLTGMALVCAAILIAPAGGSKPNALKTPRGRQFGIALGVAVLAVLSASAARQYAADWYLERGTDALGSKPAAALEDARRSLTLNPENTRAYYLQAAVYARRNDYRRTRLTLREAARREPFNYVPWRLLGDAARRRGDRGQAARAYAEASRRNPQDLELRELARESAARG